MESSCAKFLPFHHHCYHDHRYHHDHHYNYNHHNNHNNDYLQVGERLGQAPALPGIPVDTAHVALGSDHDDGDGDDDDDDENDDGDDDNDDD